MQPHLSHRHHWNQHRTDFGVCFAGMFREYVSGYVSGCVSGYVSGYVSLGSHFPSFLQS